MKAFVNGEELALNFPTLTDTLYVVVDLRGSCSSLLVTSRRAIASPLTSVRLQDSLEIALDQEQLSLEAPIASEELISIQDPCSLTKYEIHENHGRNIEILDDKTTARRVASYNQGIILINSALEVNSTVQIMVLQVDTRWQSSLIVGIVCGTPDRLNLPVTALGLKGPCCIIANDWISINGTKVSFYHLLCSIKKYVYTLIGTKSDSPLFFEYLIRNALNFDFFGKFLKTIFH